MTSDRLTGSGSESPRCGAERATVGWRVMTIRFGLALAVSLVVSCKEPYRVGELVIVEFDDQECPGHIVDVKSRTRFRVHFNFEGHRWEEEVAVNRIVDRASTVTRVCHPPAHVAAALGISAAAKKDAEKRAAYKKGDKIKVTWRNSVYSATVLGVDEGGALRIHYDGYEDAWDETISQDRIVTAHK